MPHSYSNRISSRRTAGHNIRGQKVVGIAVRTSQGTAAKIGLMVQLHSGDSTVLHYKAAKMAAAYNTRKYEGQ